MFSFLLLSFIAGLLTALAPCVLPLLPVIIGGSLNGESNLRRTLVIVGSLGASVFVFTLLLKVSTLLIAIPQSFWQLFSGVLLIFFGMVTILPSWWDRIPGVRELYASSNKLVGTGYLKGSTWGDILIGAALGPVFSSCSPTYFVILAAVLPAHVGLGIVYLTAYVVGLALALFAISLLGQKAALWLGVASDSRGWFKKGIGALFVLVGMLILLGLDKRIEAALPAGAFGEIGIEQNLLNLQRSPSIVNTSATSSSTQSGASFLTLAQKELRYPRAPELVGPDGYINTDGKAITLSQYRGKNVVLVDFWDYSCINCQRTFPYLKSWWQKYKDQGLVIIGIHTPEFAFEQLQGNVSDAAQRFGLTYPIVLDNHYQSWSAFQNQYWPREYLIDIDGFIVHDHAGEGEYDATEQAIQDALRERAERLGTSIASSSLTTLPAANLDGVQSPETYFGSNRNEYLGNGKRGVSGVQSFALSNETAPNTLYLGGSWNILPEYAEASTGAEIEFEYKAHDVYMVATNVGQSATLRVWRDGALLGVVAGSDVSPETSTIAIHGDRLYTLIHDTTLGVHTIRIQVVSGTLDAYTFTFG